jgi:hypothetical protein
MSSLGGIGGGGGPNSLAALQAQRAFAKPRQAPALSSPNDELGNRSTRQAPITPDATANHRRPRLAYHEIQAIAQQAGYIGVSDQDIARAYTSNTSLLVDYRV